MTDMETNVIVIEVTGKMAKWIDSVLTRLNKEPKDTRDTRPITERVKTFEDAAKLVGIEDPEEWEENYSNVEPDILAYFKLRIICKALNDGWEPKFTKDERRYYPWLILWTEDELSEKSDEWKADSHLISTGDYQTEFAGFACANSSDVPSNVGARFSSHLCLKNSDLATYCGKQFIDIWADFCLIRKDSEL